MRLFISHARAGAAAIAAATLASLAAAPAVATTVSCNIPQPCALYTNAQGYGVQGTSATTSGVVGTTTFNATSASNATAALKGNDSSTNNNPYNSGFYGFSAYGYGGKGKTYHGTGLYGTSSQGNGIAGDTSAPRSGTHYGVSGIDLATDGGFNDGIFGSVTNGGWGVEGQSSDGAYGGVKGAATSGFGVEGSSTTGTGVYGLSGGTGVLGYSTGSGDGVLGNSQSGNGGHFSGSGSATGVYATSESGNALVAGTNAGVAAIVSTGNGNGADVRGTYIGVIGRSDAYPFVATNTAGSTVFQVTGGGDVQIHGSFSANAFLRTGGSATAYMTKSTTPNVEDVGSAQLVDGIATVRLEPTFAAAIDVGHPYHVFLTPGGDTHGLYVQAKSPTTFVVREAQGGRANVSFDYRIVASAAGHARERMAPLATGDAAGARAPMSALRAPAPFHPPASAKVRRADRAR